MRKLILVIAMIVFSGGAANAGWLWGPSNYSECVIKYAGPAKCIKAARALCLSCRMEYQEGLDSNRWKSFYT